MKGHMKHEKKEHHAKGGHVDMKEDEGEDPLKKGGAAKKEHKMHGEKPKARADKRARGGATITPKSPLSGAAPTKMRPGFSEKGKLDKEDD
jgi:hypothetical protein